MLGSTADIKFHPPHKRKTSPLRGDPMKRVDTASRENTKIVYRDFE